MRPSIRLLYLISIVLSSATLVSCASTPTTTTTTTHTRTLSQNTPAKKDALSVSLGNNPGRPYQILGQTKISKFNDEGIKRQEATIRDLMRKDAASLGGDAVINLHNGPKNLSGTVIAYKQILV